MSEGQADIQVGAEGVDVEAIMAQIREAVASKRARGVYDDSRVFRAEQANLSILKDEDAFLEFYLDSLHHVMSVDINDWEIRSRGGPLGAMGLLTKKLLWKLLKFYTYRLFSQQNHINSQLVTALEATNARLNRQVARLDHRLQELEGRLKTGGGTAP